MTTREQRINEALTILKDIGMPSGQLNERTAISLLALLNLTADKEWKEVTNPLLGIRGILDFAREKFDRQYAENTRESVRKYSVKQLVSAGVLAHNPDKPDRPTNSSDNCYQVVSSALGLFRKYGRNSWRNALSVYLGNYKALAEQYAQRRTNSKIPVKIHEDKMIKLSPGPHSDLIRSVIEQFIAIFVPGGELVYVGDTGSKWGYFDASLLKSLGVEVNVHGKMPDVVVYFREKNWIVLVEAVTSSGPVDGMRHNELTDLFKNTSAGLVFVTAFPSRGEIMRKYLSLIAWETEVWCASDPTHLIHFNGVRFLGPYPK
jgi:hypothetical protein